MRVFLLRHEMNLTQRDAAEKAGLTFGEWQGLEDGRDSRRVDVKVAKIALAFGYDRDWLMWGGPLDPGQADGGGPTTPGSDPVTGPYADTAA